MKKDLLLPHSCRKIGWAMLVPAAALGFALKLADFDLEWLVAAFGRWLPGAPILETLNNVALIGTLAGLLVVACSRERVEDEMIGRMRLNALLVALYANSAYIVVAALTTYGFRFFNVMVYNLLTLPAIFLAVYRWQLWRARKEATDEE